MKVRDRSAIYPRIYQWRMEREHDLNDRHENYIKLIAGINEKEKF
jgi:hypothetical protein